MGKIVATPTAGSCGILPGCLVSLYEDRKIDRRDIVMSIFTAGAFGIVIAQHASIAGAQGGCQAECGSASGMAAAAVVEAMGGTPQMCANALGMAIVNQMGLVCDPVAGLVEIPCVKRNASGTAIALCSADMALAGIDLKIPVDECIGAMKAVGDSMSPSLKETAGGGLAATETGRLLREKVFGKQ
jgi:L-serine dehydratase